MAFTWKDKKDIFKGEGIYHLTFGVVNRPPILGELRSLPQPSASGCTAYTEATELGRVVQTCLNTLCTDYPQLQIVGKQLMPNHLHVVIYMHAGWTGSIKMVARSYCQRCSKHARRIAAARRGLSAQSDCAGIDGTHTMAAGAGMDGTRGGGAGMVPSLSAQSDCAGAAAGAAAGTSYDCGNGANTLFSPPFIRTLARKGQLSAMLRYVHANPDNAWLRRQHPDLYVIRRRQHYAGLCFDTMGKTRLLDYPDRNVVALSRSLTKEQISEEVHKALRLAETGTVTYTAAINDGEKAVARAIREAGFPLVVMMLDGFPDEGTEAARYYHPCGIYHTACGEGRLLLLAPTPANYSSPQLIALTEEELQLKAQQKHLPYRPVPHDSKRWRMIAGNVMLQMIANETLE